ncbi:autotransporter outer membrane beta-barrel domain-containing protein [Taklimakanibacter lacteus]|uniref:autotransporter outer membrane beta-barrel domain-containing protein n=1 Tax=Taklimakanibacter lacteus TaxID=2268456 RepID=UPI000E661F83
MERQLNGRLSGRAAAKQGGGRALRRRLAATTILAAAPFLGYARQSYAACVASPAPPTFVCSGYSAATETVAIVNNADVTTEADFSVNAAAGQGLTITGAGAISFTDNYATTSIVAPTNALFVTATGDDGAIPGSITILSSGTVTGGDNAIVAFNVGTGDIDVTANGDVTGQGFNGILAFDTANGGSITITTGADSTVTGDDNGIHVRHFGSGDIDITANGEVEGETQDGITAYNAGASSGTPGNGVNLKITTGAGSSVTGYDYGISAYNEGSGYLAITANGYIRGETASGIYARNSAAGTDLTITTGPGSEILGDDGGINASNYGSGDLEITANGAVTGYGSVGIGVYNSAQGGKLTITTGAGSVIRGAERGISAEQEGAGDVLITANGEVTGEAFSGIEVANSSGGKLTIITGAQSVVTGGTHGIFTDNHGYGDLVVTANGIVTGRDGDGIFADSSSSGDNLKGVKVTTGAASIITGSENGIHAYNFGDLDLEITVNGVVTGQGEYGIDSRNDGNGDTIIKIGASGLVQGNVAGIFAYSGLFAPGGQAISITNDGLVRNVSGESDDRAITARGGPTTIDNNGDLVGAVWTSTYGDVLNNAGRWFITGSINDFGGSYDGDVINNSGTIIAGDNAAVGVLTIIDNVEQFNNSGLVSLVDGGAIDTLNISALPGDVLYVGNNGRLAVDAELGPTGEADQLVIYGDSSGKTLVAVNVVDVTGINTDGIAVVQVYGATAEEHFDLEGGVLNAGFFAWNLRLDGDTHELFTAGLGAGSYEFAAGITGAQDIWHQTTGTLLQRQAELRALLAGTQVTPVADFSEPVEPTPVGRVTPGLWFKGVGAYLERDQDEANNVSTDRSQEIYGFMAGFDFGSESAGEAWMFGLFGGYVTSDLDFDQSGSEWHYEGPSVGVYATYLNDAFYADVTVKADFLDVDIDASDIAPGEDDADTDVLNIGGLIDAGYKMPLNHGLFAEPQASLAVVHTEIDDIDDVMGGAVDFEDETSVRGRLGLRLGHELTASNQLIYSSDVTASVWQEFAGDNDVTIAAPGFPVSDVSDSPSETYGDVALGFSVQSPEGWSSFLRANYQFAEDYDAFAGNAGVRFAW